MAAQINSRRPTFILIGLESVGKSALFRTLTGDVTGDEANFRGSTVTVRAGALLNQPGYVVDTPGIREEDNETTRLTLEQLDQADTVILVARGTRAKAEIETLLKTVHPHLGQQKIALVVTFADRVSSTLQSLLQDYRQRLGIPVALVNARHMAESQRADLQEALTQAEPIVSGQSIYLLPDTPIVPPQRTLFEHPLFGVWVAFGSIILLFALPVYLAYQVAKWLQPIVDVYFIEPFVESLAWLERISPLLLSLFVGDYGLITLGWYSFLWAFPVVLLMGLSIAITEETGLKDRITAALDPVLQRIGLNGQDLIPVLTGFGCNVVAVYQSRACSACTRKACISLIAFGSACSYQIGASLSLFNSAQRPELFAPYLLILFLVGAIHTRLWHQPAALRNPLSFTDRAFLQGPSWRGAWWRVQTVVKKFLLEAMPIFFIICGVGALLSYSGLLNQISNGVAPVLGWFGLPPSVAPGVIFSVVRKDGLLVLNQGEGALLATLSASQIFVLVYIASTLTACLVTGWSIGRELGWRYAGLVMGRQGLTSVISTSVLVVVLKMLDIG
ncbi:MAG: nucleoside recognition domain-containing protein [Chloroflexota bacterium]